MAVLLTLDSKNSEPVTQEWLRRTDDGAIEFGEGERTLFQSPKEGHWSVATEWKDGWPTEWRHCKATSFSKHEGWSVVEGKLELPGGVMILKDSFRFENAGLRVVRRFEWQGEEPLKQCTLSVRWVVPHSATPEPFMPGISYFGNPSGARRGDRVPIQTMKPGEESFYEEHRFPMPFVSIEWPENDAEFLGFGAALHSIPSRVPGGNHNDQWWSLGMIAGENSTELSMLSGPTASNGKRSVVKALQGEFMSYPDAWMEMQPGAIVEKTFYLTSLNLNEGNAGFQQAIKTSLSIFEPYSLDGLPHFQDIIRSKMQFARSRWRDRDDAGFEMYPDYVEGTHYVMGWAGQSDAMGYALLALEQKLDEIDHLKDRESTSYRDMATRSLDLLATTPFNERGFHLRYTAENQKWTEQSFVSQGQAMESFARAIELGRKRDDVDTATWEVFLKHAAEFYSARILDTDWLPVSTNEGFLISPLLHASRLFNNETFEVAALKAADHYGDRHVGYKEPYWGGTLDASCEDKEGAWAGFQAFLAAYEHSSDKKYLQWAEHAMDIAISYTAVWDMDLPAGRLRDHDFKTRGWTVVSAQNQHLDVYAVAFTPEIYKMGTLLPGRENLKQLAAVMYRSCGQLIDAYGSQGEQIQHTNFAQHGDMSDVFKLRGGYSEGWTVFWITAHFLTAAAKFEELGVDLRT